MRSSIKKPFLTIYDTYIYIYIYIYPVFNYSIVVIIIIISYIMERDRQIERIESQRRHSFERPGQVYSGQPFCFQDGVASASSRLRRGFPVEHRPDVGARSRSTKSMN